MPDSLVQRIPEDPANPYRLGRNVNHDLRSAGYPFAARPEADTPIVSRPAWPRRIGVLDQNGLGSCTGNAGAGWVGTDSSDRPGATSAHGATVDEDWAVALYSAATEIDPWPGRYPPDDTGSDGTSIAAVLKTWGLVAEYSHALGGLTDVLAALQTGPVMLGTAWYSSMFDPTPDGELRVTSGATVAGGHEYLADGGLSVEARRVWITNSWSESWGLGGRAWLSYDTLAQLLANDGDAIILHATAVINPPEPPPFVPKGCLPAIAKLLSGGRRRKASRPAPGSPD